MSDPDAPLSPAQDEAVRAHLAAARHTDPAPPDVVARLEATLGSLQAERSAGGAESPAPVVTLASRRRRRAATALLGAAAAVVLAVGVGQVLPGGPDSGSDSESASDSAAGGSTSSLEDESAADSSGPGEDDDAYSSDAAPEAQRKSTKRGTDAGAAAAEQMPALTSDSALRPQVVDLWRGHLLSSSLPPPSCPVAGAGKADQRDVLYDDEPATVVFPRPRDGFQRVQVYLCGADEPVRSARLPLR